MNTTPVRLPIALRSSLLSRVIPPVLTLFLLATLAAALFWSPAWWVAVVVFAALTALAWYDVAAAPALDPAQLPRARPHAVPAGEDPSRDPAVLHRAQLRRPSVRPRHPHVDLRAGQGHPRREGVRHRARRQRGRLRVRRALVRAARARQGAAARADRRSRLHEAVRHGAAERVRDELRGVVGQRDPRPQRRRQARRLRARHRRGRPDRLPPRERRRPDLGDRQRLLRRTDQGRRL